jgi:hypothetical protein
VIFRQNYPTFFLVRLQFVFLELCERSHNRHTEHFQLSIFVGKQAECLCCATFGRFGTSGFCQPGFRLTVKNKRNAGCFTLFAIRQSYSASFSKKFFSTSLQRS